MIDNFEKHSAIVCIDFQKEYLYTTSEKFPNSIDVQFPQLSNNVKNLLSRARDRNMFIIHANEKDDKEKSKWMPWWYTLHPLGFGDGHGDIAPFAKPLPNEVLFTKHTFDLFASVGDEFDIYAQKHQINRLYFCGVLTKACVMFSANSAFLRGYEVYVLEDCCGDRSVTEHKAVLNLYDQYHIKVINSNNLFL